MAISRTNPFDVSTAYATTMRLALGLAVFPGLGTGLLLVLIIGARLPVAPAVAMAWPQLAQAHGQIQALGFVLLFIVAVGLQLFPRFLSAPLQHAARGTWGALLIAAALVVRLLSQPLEPGPWRTLGLMFSAAAVPAGVLLAGSAFHGLSRRSVQPLKGPSASWLRFVAVGGLALGAVLVLYAWSGLELASGEVVVPQRVDEALIHLELAGFATCLVFGIASRIFGRFLLLRNRPALEARLPLLAAAWAVGLGCVAAGWLVDAVPLRWVGSSAELCALGTWLWLVGLYEQPIRESGTPHVTNPTRRWIRTAFAFLVASITLQTGLFARDAIYGTTSSTTELSAVRHALAQGFLMPLMVSMAARLLPIYSAAAIRNPTLLEIIVDVLFVGALVRVAAEPVGGYGPLTGPLIAVGGSVTVLGFSIFAGWLWSSLARLPPAR